MNKRILFLVTLLLLSCTAGLKAQLKTDDKGLYIKSGTPFSTDGLALIPSVDFELKNVTVIRGDAPVNWPEHSSITRVYHFSSPVVFRGTMAIRYQNSELNGNKSNALNIAYSGVTASSNYKDYALSSGCVVNPVDGSISRLFDDAITVSEATAVSSGFVIPPVIASGNTSFCEGSSVTLSTVAAASWQWYKNGVQIQGANQRDYTARDSGEYSVQTLLPNGIITVSDPILVAVSPAPKGSIVSDKGTEVSLGDEVTLVASGGKTYMWETSEGLLTKANTDTIKVRMTKTATYRVTIGNGTGCSVVESIVLTVANDYKMVKPNNMVTPNGDKVNDVWIVKNIDLYPNNEVKIFDRAGRVVYSKNGYDNTWDATFNGVALPEDTYYYVLYVDSGKGKLTGFISVVRD